MFTFALVQQIAQEHELSRRGHLALNVVAVHALTFLVFCWTLKTEKHVGGFSFTSKAPEKRMSRSYFFSL